MTEIIVGRQGTQRLPISDTTVSRRHCKLTDNGDGTYTLENLSETACTYVDGRQVLKTKVHPEAIIQLGPSFRVKVADLLPLAVRKPASTPAGQPQPPQKKEPPTFSLRPLKSVWNEYETDLLQIDKDAVEKQKEEKKKRNVQALCSSVGMLFVLVPQLGVMRFVLMGISALITVFLIMKDDDDEISAVKKNKVHEEYATKYRCPNPSCGRPFGGIPYRQIEFTKQCLSCGCKYTH